MGRLHVCVSKHRFALVAHTAVCTAHDPAHVLVVALPYPVPLNLCDANTASLRFVPLPDAFMTSAFNGQAVTARIASKASGTVSMKIFDWKRRGEDSTNLGEHGVQSRIACRFADQSGQG